ncbi:hypothetical protein IscW_ISCW014624 [Ixodes scapularis]|uniref:Uncharacterized protein n=1 Tax=Ixodes scapularis TaxID=6945 RepID=B7QIR6_IXOSC|nr:hypothetical protein IscW_ISCW014624 [Ixodes scapularis]|eukprot:XP_002415073.1 hypothetical protein IscW_ISCW014624 [Ixodes scapularis]
MNKQNVGSYKMALPFFVLSEDVPSGDFLTGTCLGLCMKRAQQRPEDRPPIHLSAERKIFPFVSLLGKDLLVPATLRTYLQ